jgi:hypothetical protein
MYCQWGCINIQYIPIHAGCIGMYQKIRRMYWDVSKDVLDVNTSTSRLLHRPIHQMYWKMAICIQVYWRMYQMYCFHGRMYWMMYCCHARMYQVMYWKIAGCTVSCNAGPVKDVLDVLRLSINEKHCMHVMTGGNSTRTTAGAPNWDEKWKALIRKSSKNLRHNFKIKNPAKTKGLPSHWHCYEPCWSTRSLLKTSIN